MKRWITPSFIVALVLLATGEIALRSLLSAQFIARFEGGFSQTAGFEEHADGTVHVVDSGGRRFHPQTFTRKRPPGVFRIFVLGDSVEYYGGDSESMLSNTYPARLGVELRARGIKAESFNMGITGAGSRLNASILRQVIDYQPSLIILKINDTNEGAGEFAYQRAQGLRGWHPKNWLRKSYLVETLFVLKEDHLLFNLLPVRIWLPNVQPMTKNGGGAMQDVRQEAGFRQSIKESVALARSRNIPVLLVTQTFAERDSEGRVIKLSDHGLSAFAEEIRSPGVSCFSLQQLFTPLPAQPVLSDAMHLTDAGDRMVAHALAEQINP